MPIERVPSGIESAPEHERRAFMEATSQEIIDRSARQWRTVPREQRDATIDQTYGRGRLSWLEGFRQEAAAVIDSRDGYVGTQAIIERALGDRSVDALMRVEAICEALKAAPPEYGEEPHAEDHPYLEYDTVAPLNDPSEDAEPLSVYKTNGDAITADILFLEDMRASFPGASHDDTRRAIDGLIARLNEYRFTDAKQAIREQVERGIPDGIMDEKGKKLGRIALAGVLAAGTAIFGTITAINFARSVLSKDRSFEFSMTPFLWAFATWFVADPDLLKSMFGSEYDKEFAEIRRVTSNPMLAEFCGGRYAVHGKKWKHVVENLYVDDTDVQTLLEADHPTDQQITDAVGALVGGKNGSAEDPERDAVIRNLRTMMSTRTPPHTSTDFQRFAAIFKGTTLEEAQDFIATYVERDCANEGMRHDPAVGRTLRDATSR